MKENLQILSKWFSFNCRTSKPGIKLRLGAALFVYKEAAHLKTG